MKSEIFEIKRFANHGKYNISQVCGRNVLWNSINREDEDGFIRQAEALL